MRLQRLLRLLPIGLVVLVALNMAMMLFQDRQSRATFDQVGIAQVQRDVLGKIRTNCEALTFKAVAWTLTRRSSQGRQYQDGKRACLDVVSQAEVALPQAREALASLNQRLLQLAGLLEAIQSEHTDENKMVTVGRLEREVQPLTASIHQSLDDITRTTDDESARLMAAALKQQEKTLWFGGLAGVLAIVIGALLVHVVTRRILMSVAEAVRVATALAEGDLGVAPRVRRADEIGQLLDAMDKARLAWIAAIGEIHIVTQYIAEAADDIANDAGTLNERSVHAASNLRETARSMSELLSTVEASTASARRAAELAGVATGSAHEGETAVGEVVKTMDALSAASSKIGEIIGVIDAIAFQTNILALNAAVEAARAGEQGRGFAVVAAEVRSLAHRSAAAAKEIKTLIDASGASVAMGTDRVRAAGQTMGEIVDGIQRVSQIIVEINGAMTEQSVGIGQINQAVADMDRATQQNAALVEESTAASSVLNEQAHHLSRTVAGFTLEGRAPARDQLLLTN